MKSKKFVSAMRRAKSRSYSTGSQTFVPPIELRLQRMDVLPQNDGVELCSLAPVDASAPPDGAIVASLDFEGGVSTAITAVASAQRRGTRCSP